MFLPCGAIHGFFLFQIQQQMKNEKTKQQQIDELLVEFKKLIQTGTTEEVETKETEIKEFLNNWLNESDNTKEK